jgi:hypothetical protein
MDLKETWLEGVDLSNLRDEVLTVVTTMITVSCDDVWEEQRYTSTLKKVAARSSNNHVPHYTAPHPKRQ